MSSLVIVTNILVQLSRDSYDYPVRIIILGNASFLLVTIRTCHGHVRERTLATAASILCLTSHTLFLQENACAYSFKSSKQLRK